MAAGRVDGDGGFEHPELAATAAPPAPGVPQTREAPDGALAAAVDEAVLGDVLADLPEAQPDRPLTSATDVSSLYVRHRHGLAAHARRFLRDQRDIDEVVQETFLRLFLAIGEIETELQAIAFARRTLTNLCIDRYRADRRRPTMVNLETAPVGELAGDDDEDPVLRAEDAAIVRHALAQLSPLHRAALVKREIEEKPLPQIAAELEIPEESVKHLLFRARRALRRLLVGTSVQPGVDLTAGEIASIANRRAGEALLRGGNVFIVIVVGAIVAAFGMRSLEGRTPTAPASTGTVGQAVPNPASTPTTPKTHHRRPVSLHQLPPPAASHSPAAETAPPTIAPVEQPPIKSSAPTKSTAGTFGAARSRLKLSGPLRVTGAPQVTTDGVTASDGGATVTSASSFTAETSAGTFDLSQSVSTSPVTGDTVSVAPAFVVGNAVEAPALTDPTSSVSVAPDGTVQVLVVSGATPDPSTNAFPMTSISVNLVLSADLASVVAETVVLSTAPPKTTTVTATPPGSGPTGPPATSTPPPGSGTSASGTGAVTASGGTTAGPDTISGPAPGSQAATPGVLEISDKSGDDQVTGRSFTTSEGVSS
ncbi:MAG TPA: sigma-70 family RNA polymerase sigma factor [Mycobacteriales bacterium]|nr:sigma-70 family RNA polymerase sigma factor [Mycobacteriales bacterium]